MAPNLSTISTTTLHFLIISTLIFTSYNTNAQPLFPAILVFGDSTVDTGNNNHLSPVLFLNRGDHAPYGRDYPGHISTGRFSNGKLLPDFISSVLGLKETVPPFLDPGLSDQDLLTGVSFASSGSGFDDLTSSATGGIPMSKQRDLMRKYVDKVEGIAGESEAKRIVNNAVVVLSAGTTDLVLNFYDLPTRRLQFNITGYHEFILQQLKSFIEEIYEQGCRTIAVSGVPPIGCLPIQITAKFTNPKARACLDEQNLEAQTYNDKLQELLPKIQSSLPGSRLLYADIYTPLMERIIHPKKYDVQVRDKGCCGTGFFEVGGLCNKLKPPCKNASEYVFWDSVHPTEATYQYIFLYLLQDIGSQLIGGDSLSLANIPANIWRIPKSPKEVPISELTVFYLLDNVSTVVHHENGTQSSIPVNPSLGLQIALKKLHNPGHLHGQGCSGTNIIHHVSSHWMNSSPWNRLPRRVSADQVLQFHEYAFNRFSQSPAYRHSFSSQDRTVLVREQELEFWHQIPKRLVDI
ncbi:hypothetical protein V2J09_019021 [Rumex salicifolius]